MAALWTFIAVVGLVVLFLVLSVKVMREYERAVVFRLGRLMGIKGPGVFVLIPLVDQAVRVDLRTVTLNVPPQELITRDNVTVTVNAVAYFRVLDAAKAIVQVENYLVATSQISQTTLRSVLGQIDLDQLLAERDQINDRLQAIIDKQTAPGGVKVSVVEIKDIELPVQMQRALARQAEAERDRRAKVIAAEGEYQASTRLHDAARTIALEPIALQLRYLQTMNEIASERTSTMIIPFPIDLFEPFIRGHNHPLPPSTNGGGNGPTPEPPRG
jgi:regulator of protease activity HflC (stomatin/prohibitin superfamily)